MAERLKIRVTDEFLYHYSKLAGLTEAEYIKTLPFDVSWESEAWYCTPEFAVATLEDRQDWADKIIMDAPR